MGAGVVMNISSSKGFSLVETMIALGVLTTGVLGTAAVLATGMQNLSSSPADVVVTQKAAEAVEAVFSARDSRKLTWTQINNVSAGGIFLNGAQSLKLAGLDGLVNTGDDTTVETVTFLLNSSGDPASIGPAVRQSIRQIDPSLPVLSLRTLNEQIDRHLTMERLIAQLAAFFGAVALFMAAMGLYGVMSYSISRRTSEIGLRMALGASGTSVIAMVLGETLRIVAIGITIGLPCALALGRLISSRLYGVTAADPTAIAMTTLIILTAAALAGYMPARRASRVDPMVSLRQD